MKVSIMSMQRIANYGYSSRITKQEGKEIKHFAKKNGLKLIAIGGEHSFCDVSIYPKPFEVLSIIKNAAYVVTDTFHGRNSARQKESIYS